ncbi:YHS domain family [Planktothrix serta PCC 8927]|uniref:YHS domain family n=1 Tax=Planktothrix serta PCC 8927 TaxID=671068 RepID=A0A7Z9BPT3_9CYAN|nr:YHS domain-containing (seleno)protein [Planktothrix serta]VXD19711.1 YHS domain family [Planktothrix serta PCC 8927]
MKVQYITTIAIAAILGLVTANISNANSNVLTRSNSITLSSQVAQSNPCAGKDNPCAGKANPCAGKTSAATTRHPQFYTENGIALDGQDVVAYFTQNKLMTGMSQFKHSWGGTNWLFSSAANRDLFAQNPEKYAPQYGGYCAQGASEAHLVATQPDAWKIVNGKLYLNYDKTVQAQWITDIPGHIASANKNWPAILNNNDLFR